MATKTSETNTATTTPEKKITVGNASVNEKEMKDSSLHQFFVSALKDIYFAENAIIDALEKMQEAATTEELKDAFEDHQLQTKKHVSRLEKVFKLIDEKPEKKVEWQAGDAVYIPSWGWHKHQNFSDTEPAKYIACENAPQLQNLGVALREEEGRDL